MRAIDGKHRDTSLRLVFASVPVQALLMAGAASLALGGASASHGQGWQVKPAGETPAVLYGACPPGQVFLPDKGAQMGYPDGSAPGAAAAQGPGAWPTGKGFCVATGDFGPDGPAYFKVVKGPGCC